MSKHKSLIRETPIIFGPSLAVLVGVEAAIILQRIAFLCQDGIGGGRVINEERWIWNTYEDWKRHHFPFWSVDTIKRAVLFLEEKGYLLSCQPDGRMSRKKYYRVSTAFDELATLERAKEVMEGKELLPVKRSQRSTISRSGQIAPIERCKLPRSMRADCPVP
jgi:hypothetical protein